MKPALIVAQKRDDILLDFRGTPIADLLAYHNMHELHRKYSRPELLVGMCMDNRKHLRIPVNFAYIIRTAGANLRGLEFQISYAVAVGGVRAIALIGHDQCAMTDLAGRREPFVAGLTEGAGWSRRVAEAHFDEHAPRSEIGDPAQFVRSQALHLRRQYPRLVVAPLMYRLKDQMLLQIREGKGSNL